jgi:hypothetical protein
MEMPPDTLEVVGVNELFVAVTNTGGIVDV